MICIIQVKDGEVVSWMTGSDLERMARRADFSGYRDLGRALRAITKIEPHSKTILVERTEIGGKLIMLVDGMDQ